MAVAESSEFCASSVYEAGRHQRLRGPGEMELGSFATMMCLLKARHPYEAARMSVCIKGVETDHDSGLYEVRFTFVDCDLVEKLTTAQTFEDGYAYQPRNLNIHPRNQPKKGYAIEEAYIRSPEMHEFDDELATLVNQDLVYSA